MDELDQTVQGACADAVLQPAGLPVGLLRVDAQNVGHTCLVYVLTGKGFSATCVIQYPDADQDNVLPLVRKTLDSFQAAS